MTRSLRVLACLLLVTLLGETAWAGGMLFSPRGARPLGRAGAFVAGADDGNALYYNPAGLGEISGWSFLVDGALVLQTSQYTRVDSGGNTLPTVKGSYDVLPLPQLVLTYQPRKHKWFTVGGGIWTPYLGLNSFKEDGPQRYSHITLNGSLTLIMELAFSFRVHKNVYLGVGFQNMILKFVSRIALSACTELNCAPEDPGFDSLTEVEATSYFTPSAIFGLTVALEKVRFAVAAQLPFWVRANGKVSSRLPSDPQFVDASLVGDKAKLAFNLPFDLRIASELRLVKGLRVEAMFSYAGWSMQKDFAITPQNIYIDGIPGVGRYYLGPMSINRSMKDVIAFSLGGEYEALQNRLWLRLGWMIETSATPDKTQTVLTPDGLRNYLALGISTKIKNKVRLDFSYAHVFINDRNVTNSESYQLNPIRPQLAVAVGNGRYKFEADILTAGLEGRW